MSTFSAGGAAQPARESNLERLRCFLDEARRHDRPVVQTPSMINHHEQRFLQLLASDYFADRGVIVDAGIFLGASTRCLATGLQANPAYPFYGHHRIQAYDLCRCDDYMADLINGLHGTVLKPGDSFELLLQSNLADVRDDVDLRLGDITGQVPEGDIEILFLDVCKDPTVNRHVVQSFFPRLIPGVSVVVHQDFVHESLPWIHVSMGVLADYFEFVGIVGDFGPSAVYLCKERIDPSVRDVYGFASLPVLQAAFETAVAELDEVQRFFVDLAYTRLLAGRGRMDLARRELDRLDDLHDRLKQRCSYLPTTARHRARLDTDWAALR